MASSTQKRSIGMVTDDFRLKPKQILESLTFLGLDDVSSLPEADLNALVAARRDEYLRSMKSSHKNVLYSKFTSFIDTHVFQAYRDYQAEISKVPSYTVAAKTAFNIIFSLASKQDDDVELQRLKGEITNPANFDENKIKLRAQPAFANLSDVELKRRMTPAFIDKVMGDYRSKKAHGQRGPAKKKTDAIAKVEPALKKRGRLGRGEISDTDSIKATTRSNARARDQIDIQVNKLTRLQQKVHDQTYEGAYGGGSDDDDDDVDDNDRVELVQSAEYIAKLEAENLNVLKAEETLLACYARRTKFKTELGDLLPRNATRFTAFTAGLDKVAREPFFVSSAGTMQTAEEKSDIAFAVKVALNRSARDPDPRMADSRKKQRGSQLAIKSETERKEQRYKYGGLDTV
jgi:hypothetical protein